MSGAPQNPAPQVDRCVCHSVTFAELLRLNRAGHDLASLQRNTGCGTSCSLCLPYIRAALVTGRTSLPIMTPAELAELERSARANPAADQKETRPANPRGAP